MSHNNATYFYPTTALGADSTERTIFDTNADPNYANGAWTLYGFKRAIVSMNWDTGEAQTLKFYYYPYGSTTAAAAYSEAITVTSPDDVKRDWNVAGYWGIKITLTNDGSAKTRNNVAVTLSKDQAMTV